MRNLFFLKTERVWSEYYIHFVLLFLLPIWSELSEHSFLSSNFNSSRVYVFSNDSLKQLNSRQELHTFFCVCCGFQMAVQCVSKIELSISCNNLLDKDVGSKSDPLCVLLQSVGDDKWTEVSYTL